MTLSNFDRSDAVEQQGAPSAEEKISAAIRTYVAGRLHSKESDIRVHLLQSPESETASGEIVEVKEGSQSGVLGRVVFLIATRSKGKPAGYEWITANVEMIRSVLVSTRSLRRAQVIQPEDLELRSIGVVHVGESYPLDPEMLIGKRLIRSLSPGAPISLEMIETAPIIHPGDRVTLLVESRGLRIATIGRAKEEGFPGKSLAIVNLDSQKTIYGEVIDASTVKVILPE